MSNAMINSDLKEYDKKFVVEDNTLWEVWSNKISKSEVIWDMENICDLLNSLCDENEQLKKQLEIRTESDKYHQRMLMKWLCKDDGDDV